MESFPMEKPQWLAVLILWLPTSAVDTGCPNHPLVHKKCEPINMYHVTKLVYHVITGMSC